MRRRRRRRKGWQVCRQVESMVGVSVSGAIAQNRG